MTKKMYKYRGNQQIDDVDGFLREGESYRAPTMISDSADGQQSFDSAGQQQPFDSAGGQRPVLDALADRASDLHLDQAARVVARDELHRRYAELAAAPTLVLKYPGMFDEKTRDTHLVAPVAAGRDSLEAVYASYEASIRDAWQRR